MKPASFLTLLLLLAMAGCSSKAKQEAAFRSAFVAGQQSAQTLPAGPPPVTIIGQVKTPRLLWSQGLTLSRAIIQAEYIGRHDPRTIQIVRQGERFPVAPRALLRGEYDPLLEPGDVIELQP